ncbi:MAG: UDP-3-O-(3-hydroxymyristoyl)glucosamine N-acyltransferase [Bacteroidales bacterium]|jgi:UDP-3-O-[3-hydroxymyristoyl] glucosamine N-acyltransferase|nr:UDP-3-O-(3-hydroxymyristoyl)glucosamine N-acyltransferase [Bacteroidales bacterium]
MEFTIKQIADFLQGDIEGGDSIKINNLAKIEQGETGTLSFLANPKYTQYIYTCKSSAVIVNKDFKPEQEIAATLIRVDDAYSSFAKMLTLFSEQKPPKGISRKTKIHRSAKIGKNVFIGDFVSIAEGVTIGDNTIIHQNVTIYKNVTIKSESLIYAGVQIMENCEIGNNCILLAGAIIGSDGFGFAPVKDGEYLKIPQTGNVILEDNVEIGANSTIDRATMGSTIIRSGAKIDNLIQIGHNCEIGSNTVIAGQTGVSGSTRIGKNCMIGGQVGIAGHLHIGDNVMIAAKSGIMVDIQDNEFHMGVPSFDARKYKKSYLYFKNFDKIAKRISELEKQVKDLKQ